MLYAGNIIFDRINETIMDLLSDNDFAKFVADYPLYSKMFFVGEMDSDALESLDIVSFFNHKPFRHHCPICKVSNAFRFNTLNNFRGVVLVGPYRDVPPMMQNNGYFSYSFDRFAICQMCSFRMDFSFNIFSEKSLDPILQLPRLFIRKTGQFPPISRNPEAEVLKYLIDEDKENYSKALSNLSVSYGIGAYAYLRRIIENEIKRLVVDITTLEYDGVEKVKAAYKKYEQDHQMSALIESINVYMPPSLIVGGQNPLKILHNVTSEGIHILSEEQCLIKAKNVDTLLQFTIIAISRMKFEKNILKEAVKNLTS